MKITTRVVVGISLLTLLLIGGIISSLKSKPIEYKAETQTVVETVEVDATEARIKSAQAEAMTRIEQEANQARDAFVENELKEIEAQVLKEVEAELKARRIEVEKTTQQY